MRLLLCSLLLSSLAGCHAWMTESPPSTLDGQAVHAVVEQHYGEAQACYDRRVENGDSSPYAAEMQLTIRGDGVVDSAGALLDAGRRHEPTDDCIAERMMTWRFPPTSNGGSVLARAPFAFASAPTGLLPHAPAPGEPAGRLDDAEVRRTIREHADEVRTCYEGGLVWSPELEGRVVVAFDVRRDGRVGHAGVERSDVHDLAVEACLVAAVRQWRFPPPAGGRRAIVEHTFELHAAPGELAVTRPARGTRSAIRAHLDELQRCYQEALTGHPGLGGMLVADLDIDADGVVRAVTRGGGSTLGDAGLERCALESARRWQLPAQAGALQLRYPFVFAPPFDAAMASEQPEAEPQQSLPTPQPAPEASPESSPAPQSTAQPTPSAAP